MAGFSFRLVADDYAMSPAVSRGIREALAAGRLSGTGAMTNMQGWRDDARALEADGLSAKAGLHLNLTCGTPATRMRAMAPAGTLPQLQAVLKGARGRSLPRAELAGEISAQLDRFTDALGRMPAFVDGHQHVQGFPQVREILLEELARRGWQGKVWLRDSADRPDRILLRGVEGKKALVVAFLSRGFAAAAQSAGFETNIGFSGFSSFDPARDFGRDFGSYLRAPGQNHLVMCHPGYADAELASLDPNTLSRENELRFLLSDRCEEALAESGAQLKSV